jgi:hypothetical protein
MIEFNPHSTRHLAILFFGGEIKDQEHVKIGVYKTGQKKRQDKYQWVEKTIKIQGLGLIPQADWKTDKGNISLNDNILSIIAKKKNHNAGKIAALVLKLRGLQKELGTYYEGMGELIMDWDSCIHGNFNHCQTNTGRLSSSNPNQQNLPRS